MPAPESRELEDRVAVVTGGGRGLGCAIARRPLEAGLGDVVTGREADVLERAAAEIGGGDRTLAVACDVSDSAAVDELRARVEAWAAPVTVLVNNAGSPDSRHRWSTSSPTRAIRSWP